MSHKTKMISHQSRKMDKINGKWVENFTTLKVILNKESLQTKFTNLSRKSLRRSTIFKRCKRYIDKNYFERKSDSGEKKLVKLSQCDFPKSFKVPFLLGETLSRWNGALKLF